MQGASQPEFTADDYVQLASKQLTIFYAAQDRTAHTIDDYEQLADLEFALIVWRQNLKRDLATTPSKEASFSPILQPF